MYSSGLTGGGLLASSAVIPDGGILADIARVMLEVAGGIFGLYVLVLVGFIVWGRLTPQVTNDPKDGMQWITPNR